MATPPPDAPPGSAARADATVPWRSFVTEAEARLRAAGVASAEIDARRIVERASGFGGSEFFLGLQQPATERGVAHFDAMLERRLTGEPLQYVLGEWSFRTLELFVDRRVLIPRPETEVVVERALELLDAYADGAGRSTGTAGVLRALDLGTGSGAIALSLAAERPGLEVWATDVSDDALAVARANLAGIGRAATRVQLRQGSWFAALPDDLRESFALVVSNPPYVAPADLLPSEVRDWEPADALFPGPTGTEALEVLVDQAPGWLRPGGALVLELAPHQAATIAERAKARGYVEVEVGRDLAGRERFVAGRRPPGP